MNRRGLAEPLRHLGQVARGPAPIIGFERPPDQLVEELRAAAADVAAAAGSLALLESAPRSCTALLEELAARQVRAERRARDVLRARRAGLDRRLSSSLTLALADIAAGTYEAAHWWCRSAGCEPAAGNLAAVLRDATRALDRAIEVLPDPGAAERAGDVHRRVSEGRRLARRARAAAIDRGELREVLVRRSAVAAVESALESCGRAARTLQQLCG
jgi:hypothetical protein